jgi:tripartite-type tricarboxylate transporter receptor subunit TctC
MMRLRWLGGLVATLVLAFAAPVHAQDFPSRPIRMVVAFPPGGPTDFVARILADKMKTLLGQAVVIDNRPGANAAIGADYVAKAEPDGYTIFFTTMGAVAINPNMRTDLPYDPVRDFAPISVVVNTPEVLVVRADNAAKTAKDLVEYAKTKPDGIIMGSTGVGSPPHLALELLKTVGKIKVVHVPYRGAAPVLTDLIGGQVQVYFGSPLAGIEYIRAGKLRALAVTTATRAEALPDIPTVGEFVPGYEASTVFGLGAPRNTPARIIDKLNKEINGALADPTFKARFADLGGTVLALSPADFGKLIAEETEKWAKVISAGNIMPE